MPETDTPARTMAARFQGFDHSKARHRDRSSRRKMGFDPGPDADPEDAHLEADSRFRHAPPTD
jgi:hypothetical protein